MSLPQLQFGAAPRILRPTIHYSALLAKKGIRVASAPAKCDYLTGMPANPTGFTMMGNDQYGDCCFAGAGHLRQIITWNALKAQRSITTAEALQFIPTLPGSIRITRRATTARISEPS